MKTPNTKFALTLVGALALSAQLGCATNAVTTSHVERDIAADFSLPKLPESENLYDLNDISNQSTYYSFMEDTVTPELKRLANEDKSRKSNEDALAAGKGIGVKLDEINYNFHVNFPDGDQGGRSYGWTKGQVGDWSDKMYLTELGKIMTADDADELSKFYTVIIQVLGASNPAGISDLNGDTQRVANNFLAIYTAEEYRAMVGKSKWDDALLQVTMLGAFHGGQETFTKYYLGKFSNKSKKQAPGVYKGKVRAASKDADFTDYWQFSANETSKRSGINLTRGDFEKMGKALTSYYADGSHRSNIKAIQKIVGDSPNVIKSISTYFTDGNAEVDQTDELAKNVAKFLVQVNKDANKITEALNKDDESDE